MPHAYFHTVEGDAILKDGWESGESEADLLDHVNRVLANLPYDVEPMTRSGMIRRVRALRLFRSPEHRGQMLHLAWKGRHINHVATRDRGQDPVTRKIKLGVIEAPADLQPLKDGAPSSAMREIAIGLHENAMCRIDREGALEWGRRWRAGSKIDEINEGRLAYGLPKFEVY